VVGALAAEHLFLEGLEFLGVFFAGRGWPYDGFPRPFPNVLAGGSATGGAAPPDLSLMAKARGAPRGLTWALLDFFTQYQEGGPDYVHALLTGYPEEAPAGIDVPDETYYNPYFLNGVSLKMAPPLADGLIEYADGSPQTVDQYAKDVAAFLMWTAEPHLVERKRLGFMTILFLVVFAGLMYLTKKKVWSNVAH
jgi:ubiquinol-cytochrome c reductase cytochrome c1 subunit